MLSSRELANAIRALSMDAVEKPNQVTLGPLLAWPIWQKDCGAVF